MLLIRELAIGQFRSYRRAEIVSDGRSVALVGPNGAGKTNVLEAISLVSPGRGLRRVAAAEMARRDGPGGWRVVVDLEISGRVHEVETWSESNASRQLRIDGKGANQLALGRMAQILWLVPPMDRIWIEGADGRRRFLDRMALSFDPGHGEAALVYEKAMRNRNRLLKNQTRDGRWFDALETRMAEAGMRIHRGRIAALEFLSTAQEKAVTAFPAARLELVQSEGQFPESEEALRAALRDSRARDMAAGRTLVGTHRSDLQADYVSKGVSARTCSTGEQKALLISLILANARALTERVGHAPILLLDEVAAHLDAERRAALYSEISVLGAQAWMTGTGPELFEDLGDRVQLIPVCEEAGISRLQAV